MAVANQTIQDSRYRTIVKTVSSGTTSAGSILDVSGLTGHVTSPLGLVTIAKISWSLSSQADILWDATSNVVSLSLSGSGKVGFVDCVPSIPNNGGSGVSGDLAVSNSSASVGTIWLRMKKVSGWDNIT